MKKAKTRLIVLLIVMGVISSGCKREEEVKRTVEAGIQLVNYYKMVAQQYMKQDLFGLAADFYRKALDVQSAGPLFAYRLGACTSLVARSQPDEADRMEAFELSLEYHRYALRLDPSRAALSGGDDVR